MLGVKPYIAFPANCREAIDFYTNALGATTTALRRAFAQLSYAVRA